MSMVQCPHCWEPKQLYAPVCPHCRRETHIQTHLQWEAEAWFGAACISSVLFVIGLIWWNWDDMMAMLPAFLSSPWETGKAIIAPFVVKIIQLFGG